MDHRAIRGGAEYTGRGSENPRLKDRRLECAQEGERLDAAARRNLRLKVVGERDRLASSPSVSNLPGCRLADVSPRIDDEHPIREIDLAEV